MRIYYVGAQLSASDSKWLGANKVLHATVIYSRQWFPYQETLIYPIIITPPFQIAQFGNNTVLLFYNKQLIERHNELIALGASWDYENYNAHITVPNKHIPVCNLLLTNEYYKTWEEK